MIYHRLYNGKFFGYLPLYSYNRDKNNLPFMGDYSY